MAGTFGLVFAAKLSLVFLLFSFEVSLVLVGKTLLFISDTLLSLERFGHDALRLFNYPLGLKRLGVAAFGFANALGLFLLGKPQQL